MNFTKENIIILRIDQQWNNLYIVFYNKETKTTHTYILKTFKHYFYYGDNNKDFIVDRSLVKRVMLDKPWKMKELSMPYENTFENDLDLKKRFYCDFYKGIRQIDRIKPKTFILDIECLMTGEFTQDGRYPISAISIYNTEKNEMITWGFRQDKDYQDTTNKIFIYANEYKMLEEFIKYWKAENAQVITGWNIYFDVNYICNRLMRVDNELGTNWLRELSPFSITQQKYKSINWEIFGVSIVDYMAVYKKFYGKELKSKKLEYIAKKELGQGKVKFEEQGGDLNKLYNENFEKYIEYNRFDVELIRLLEEKLQYLDTLIELNSIGINNLEDAIETSKTLDSLFIRIMNGINKVVRSKVWGRDAKNFPFPGGFLLDVDRDFYTDLPILVFDASSLYPSIGIMLSISMESLNPNGNIVSGAGSRFKESGGIVSQFFRFGFNEKDKYEKLMNEAYLSDDKDKAFVYKTKRQAWKILINSLFGFISYINGRYFNTDMKNNLGNAITSTGQLIIQAVIKYLRDKGFHVVYSDTDSVGVINESFRGKTLNELVDIGKEIRLDITNISKKFISKRFNTKNVDVFNFAFEKIVRGIHFKRRRYVHKLLWEKGKFKEDKNEMDYKGVEVVRADCSPFSEKLMMELYNEVLNNNKTDFHFINSIVERYREELKSSRKEDLGIPFALSKKIEEYKKDDPKTRGVKYYNEYLKKGNMDDFSIGKGKYYYISKYPSNMKETDVISLPEGGKFPLYFEVDMDKVFERFIDNKIKLLMMIVVKRQFMNGRTIEELTVDYSITTKKKKYKGVQTVKYLSDDIRPETKYIIYNLNNDIDDDIEDEAEETTNLPFTEGDERMLKECY